LLTPSSQSILGRGTAIPINYLKRCVYPTLFPNSWLRKNNWYILPFCDSVQASLGGSQGGGYYTFEPNGASPFLEFGIPAAAVKAIDNIHLNSAATGFYRLSYKGFDTPPIAADATIGVIKANLEALPSMRDADGNPITVTATGTFDLVGGGSGVDIVYTSDNALNPEEQVTFINLAGDAVHQERVTRTTQGKEGWNASATNQYDITVYAMMFRNVLSKQGRLAITDE
jgi:hypothetical protein